MRGRRILLCSRDPGGTNAIMPLIEPLRASGNEVSVYGKDAALSIYRKLNLGCTDICDAIPRCTQEETDDFVQKARPDLLMTGTSSEDFTERRLWKAADRAGIASFAVLDQWTHYRLRFIGECRDSIGGHAASDLTLPSRLFVMDDFAKAEISALGIDPQRLIVSGQPHFDYIRKSAGVFARQDIDRLRRKLIGSEDGLIFIFASQPIASIHRKNGMPEDYWGYTEETVFKSLMECLSKLTVDMRTKVTLVLRLHPKDEPNAYQTALTKPSPSLNVMTDRETDSSLLLMASDLTIGMFSMLLLEAAILERRFIGVQIGLKRESPLIFDHMGSARSILTENELEETLRGILSGDKDQSPQLRFEFGATEKIVKYLEEYK